MFHETSGFFSFAQLSPQVGSVGQQSSKTRLPYVADSWSPSSGVVWQRILCRYIFGGEIIQIMSPFCHSILHRMDPKKGPVLVLAFAATISSRFQRPEGSQPIRRCDFTPPPACTVLSACFKKRPVSADHIYGSGNQQYRPNNFLSPKCRPSCTSPRARP